MTDDATPIAPPDATLEKPWPPWASAYLLALAQVPNVSRAAELAGIDRGTAYRLTQRDETFAVAAHAAREQALDRLEEVIYAAATRGLDTTKTVTRKAPDGTVIEETTTSERHTNPTLAMFYLKRWRPEYREAFVVENTGPGGGALKHEVTVIDEAVAEFRAKLARLAADDGPDPD